MKCQRCEKPATVHITELTGEEPVELHLCEEHAKDHFAPAESNGGDIAASLAGAFAEHLKVGQTVEELSRLDKRTCPMCGISFFEFRNQGRLGCPHDYEFFLEELEPLLVNIHGDLIHKGKRPTRLVRNKSATTELIRLRREMKEAIEKEDYEVASRLRDKIKQVENDLASEK
jgi:protein arginine kinase activator